MNQTEHALRNESLAKRAETLQQYVSDRLATAQHIQEVIERQLTGKRVQQQPEPQQVIRIGITLQQHVEALERQQYCESGHNIGPRRGGWLVG